MPASPYWEVSVSAPAEASEGLQNFAWELGALGVVEEEGPDGAACLRAFFPPTATAAALAAAWRQYLESLRTLGFDVAEAGTVAPITDPGWAEAWRAHFRPLPIGRRLLVTPPWETCVPGDRLVITIEPGRAFGTGHHATTAGCLELMEACVERTRPPLVLDLGTGSGILAIAAVLLGVKCAIAVDEDPDAIANARLNLARNGVANRVRCERTDAGEVHTGPAPLVLANLVTPAHQRLAPAYGRYVALEGTLIAGGILDTEADAVTAALGAAGFTLRRALAREGWTTLELGARS